MLTRLGADEGDVASWMSYDDDGGYSAIYVAAGRRGRGAVLRQRAPGRFEDLSARREATYGSTGVARLGTLGGRKNESGLDVNSVWQMSMGTGKAVIPKDAPGLAYPLHFGERGPRHVFATTRVPLGAPRPGRLAPAPLDSADYSRKDRPVFTTFRFYFSAPEGSKDRRFISRGRAAVPAGWQAVPGGEPLSGRVNLPADRPGLLGVRGVVNQRVQVRNLPPFFAVGDPESLFCRCSLGPAGSSLAPKHSGGA